MGGTGSGRKPLLMERHEPKPISEPAKPKCEKKWTVEINYQEDQFSSLDQALEYARKLLDAKVWYFKVSSKDADF